MSTNLTLNTIKVTQATFEFDYERQVKLIRSNRGNHINSPFYAAVIKHVKDNLGEDILFESANDSAAIKLMETDEDILDLNTLSVIIRPVGRRAFKETAIPVITRTIIDKVSDYALFRQGASALFVSGKRSKISKHLNPQDIRRRANVESTVSPIGLIYPIYKFEFMFR